MKKIYKEIENKLLKPTEQSCAKNHAAANDISAMMCESMVNHMDREEGEGCPCSGEGGAGGGGESKLVDLFILVDSSSSMSSAWNSIGESYEKALELAKGQCDKDVKAIPLFVDNRDGATNTKTLSASGIFTQSHESYLLAVNPSLTNTDFRSEDLDDPWGRGYPGEAGAEAMIDLMKHHPWRAGACRSILYVSDTWLDGEYGTTPQAPQERADARTAELIAVANVAGVTLFAHHLNGYGGAGDAASNQNYQDFTNETNGALVSGGAPNAELYTDLLVKAVCQSCANASGCATVEYPDIEPCVHVSWGASDCDCIESHDDEVICISLCNCYSNVTFENVSLAYAVVVDEKGNLPPLLPDGAPSVHLYPTGPICFGDIGPCVDGEETCVSRQFVLLTRGAVSGKYKIKLGGICFGISKGYQTLSEVEFEICKD